MMIERQFSSNTIGSLVDYCVAKKEQVITEYMQHHYQYVDERSKPLILSEIRYQPEQFVLNHILKTEYDAKMTGKNIIFFRDNSLYATFLLKYT